MIMFRNKKYKRFKKLYDYLTDINCKYTIEFDGVCYKYKTFKTKLGERAIIADKIGDSIVLAYHDYDNSLLFCIVCDKNGRITIPMTKIDEIAIFSAIYEIESIIWDKKQRKRGEMLESLMSYYRPYAGWGWYGFN